MASFNWLKLIPLGISVAQDIAEALKPESDGGKNITSNEIVDIILDALAGAGVSIGLDVTGTSFLKDLLAKIIELIKNKSFTVATATDILTTISNGIQSKAA